MRNKIEYIIKKYNLNVFSSTITKLLLLYKDLSDYRIFDQPSKYVEPQYCEYCLHNYHLVLESNDIPDIIDAKYYCKKHKGIYLLINSHIAKLTLNNEDYFIVGNWVFYKDESLIIELYLPHINKSLKSYTMFLLPETLIDFTKLNFTNITDDIQSSDVLWSHVSDRRYIELWKVNNEYKWKIKFYTPKLVNVKELMTG